MRSSLRNFLDLRRTCFFLFNLLFFSEDRLYSQVTVQNLLFNSSDNVTRLNFSSPVPTLFYTNTTSGASLGEGLAHAEDGSGNIIFYVNSGGVYNRNFALMSGSSTIYANPSSSEINVCPFPSDPNKYYVFYNREQCSSLYYSLVDMTLNGGLGGVVSLNTLLDNAAFGEGIEIIRIPCTPNFWLVSYQCNTGFKRFLVSNSGVGNGTAIQSLVSPSGYDGRGELDYHNGKIGIAFAWATANQTYIAGFDPYSGTMSNGRSITFAAGVNGCYGLEFSPDASKVFFSDWYNSNGANLFQYDLAANSFINQWSVIVNGTPCGGLVNGLGQIELGPNGKLYVIQDEGCGITEINNPNSAAPTLSFISVNYPLALGISDYIQSDVFTNVLIPSDQSICTLDDSMLLTVPVTLTNRYWLVDPNFNDTISTVAALNIHPVPGVMTTYIYGGVDSFGCDRRFALRVSVKPPVQLSLSTANDTICFGGATQLTASAVSSSPPVIYQWIPAAGISNPASPNPLASPASSTVYRLIATDSIGCSAEDSIRITVLNTGISQFDVEPDSASICSGDSVKLSTRISLQCGIYGNACTGVLDSAIIGTGTSASSTTSVTPYLGSSITAKHQFFYTRSELSYAGFNGGTLAGMAFNVSSITGSNVYQNFTIKMGCTSSSALVSAFETGLQTVLNPQTITLSTGWNYYNFNTAYSWDGISNLIVEICFSNSTTSSSSAVFYSGSGFVSHTYYAGSNACNVSIGTTSTNRPNTLFKHCNSSVNNFIFSWSPVSGLTNPTIENPVASPASATTYYLTAIDSASGCVYIDDVHIKVGPNFNINTSGDTILCSSAGVGISVSHNSPIGVTYNWSPASLLSNQNISNPIANNNQTTTYYVEVTSDSGCTRSDSVKVSLVSLATFDIQQDTALLCQGDSVQINTLLQKGCGTNGNVCSGASDTILVGMGSSTSSATSRTPFLGAYQSSRRQFLITQSELLSLGLTQGITINQLAFQVYSVSGLATYQNFSIKMGCTDLNNLTAIFQSGLQVVFNPKTINITAGWSPFMFDNTFDWDGNSNLIVEVCYENPAISSSSSIYYASTAFTSTTYIYSSSSVCDALTGNITTYRPNFRFRYCTTPPFVDNLVYNWTPATGVSNVNIPNPVITPTATTIYHLYATDTISHCQFADDIVVKVGSHFNVGASNDTIICSELGIPVSVTHNAGPNASYHWSPGFFLSDSTSAASIAYAPYATHFIIEVTSQAGCTERDSVYVGVNFFSTFDILPDSASLCVAEPIQINTLIQRGCGTHGIVCSGTPDSVVIGTSTASSASTSITPFAGGYKSSRRQYLITRSELASLGLSQGITISQLGFNIYGIQGSSVYDNFSIKIGCTDLEYLTSTFVTGLNYAFYPKLINVSPGWYHLNFDQTYDWDGTSNLIIEICYDNTGTSSSSSVYYTNTSHVSSIYYYSSSSACNSLTGYTYSYRPNLAFKYCLTPPVGENLVYSWSPATGVSDVNIANPVIIPSTSTTYTLHALDTITGCSYSDSLPIKLGADFDITGSGDTILCSVQGVPVSVAHTSGANVSYHWTPAIFLSDSTISNPVVNADATTTFYVEVTSDSGCTKKDSVTVMFVSATIFDVQPDSANICEGELVNVNTIVKKGCGINGSVCPGTAQVQVGTGVSYSSSGTITPFYGSYQSGRRQYLFTQAELLALGLNQGMTFTQIGLYIYSGFSSYNNFTIKMGCTSATSMTSVFQPGLKTVFYPKTINLINGWNYFILDNNYDWDGISNLLVEICFDNPSTISSSYVYYTTNSFASAIYAYSNSQICYVGSGYTTNSRPNFTFKYCATPPAGENFVYSWLPTTGVSDPNIPNPVITTVTPVTYMLYARDTVSGCEYSDSLPLRIGSNFNITVSGDTQLCSVNGVPISVTHSSGANVTYQWSPGFLLSDSTIYNPIVSADQSITFFVEVTSDSGCTKTDSVRVIFAAAVNFDVKPDSANVCQGESIDVSTIVKKDCGINGSACPGTTEVQVGTGTSYSSSSSITPFYGSYQSGRRQYLFTQAELLALGLNQGMTFTQIGLNIYTLGGSAYHNFTMKMGCTSATSMTSVFQPGLKTVFYPKTINLTSGWNYFVLDNNYDWDGVSNLLVEICYENPTTAASSYVYYSSNSFTTTTYAYSSSSGCNIISGNTTSYRPHLKFKYCVTPPAGENMVYSWSPSTGVSNPNIPNPVITPVTSGSYVLHATDTVTGCEYSDVLLVKAGSNFNAMASRDTVLCSVNGIPISVTHTSGSSVSYHWSPGFLLSDSTTYNPIVTADQSTTFFVEVVSDSGCTKTDSVRVTFVAAVNFDVQPDSAIVCAGEAVNVNTIIKKDCGINGSVCPGTAEVQVGTGTAYSSSSSITPFYGSYQSGRRQYLFTRAELFALGLNQGMTFTQIGLNIYSLGNPGFENFTIKMGCTNATLLSTVFQPGLKTVFYPKTINLTSGWNYFVLDNNYDWDGVSNLLVEICYNNPTTFTSSYVYYSSNSFTTTTYAYSSSPACNVNSGNTTSYRPNLKFKYCVTPSAGENMVYSWSPSTGVSNPNIPNPVITSVSTTTYHLLAVDTITQCQYSDDLLVVNNASSFIIIDTTCDVSPVGIDTAFLTNQHGCDSLIITITLLNPSDVVNLSDTTCDILQVGTDTVFLTNLHGCDSLVITTTTLNPENITNFLDTTCYISQIGTDTVFLTNQVGCDSLVITTTMLNPHDITNLTDTTCEVSQAGTDTMFLTNQLGCDSLVITTTTLNPNDITNLTDATCDTSQAGTDTTFLTNQFGCDSLVITTTLLFSSDTTFLLSSTCDASQAGTDTAFLINQFGCDSLVITTTILNLSDVTNLTGSTCDAAQAGTNTLFLTNQFGCDSLVITTTLLFPSDTIFLLDSTCDVLQAGVTTAFLFNQYGCDSLVTTITILNPSDVTNIIDSTCNAQQAGTDTAFLTNQFGCDSLVITTTLDLSNVTSLSHSTCDASQAGTDTAFLTNQFGCDSLVITTTTLNTDTAYLSNITCYSSQAGIDTIVLSNQFGCDSINIITTLLSPVSRTIIDTFICYGDSFFVAGAIQTVSGTYFDTLTDANGCDSIITIEVEIYPIFTDTLSVSAHRGEQVSGVTVFGDTIILEELRTIHGCDSIIARLVNILELSVYFPNAFSPNGDAVNDIYFALAQNVTDFRLLIFDRWGEKVFEAHNVNTGWDGTYTGKEAQIGVYVYYSEIIFLGKHEPELYKGSITLIR